MSQRYSRCPAADIVARKIQPGEEILWKGRPAKRNGPFHYVKYMLKGCTTLFFSCMMVLMAIACLLGYLEEPPPPQPPWVFSYIIYPALLLLGTIGSLAFATFALILLFFSMASFLSPVMKRIHHNLYVLTNRRLIVLLAEESPLVREYCIYAYSLHKLKYRGNGTEDAVLQYGKKKILEFNEITDAGNAMDILKRFRLNPASPGTGKLN